MGNLKEYFEKQLSKKKEIKFNIFSALHDIKEERRLHSRFIAYLLSRNSNHGMGNEFLKLFVKSVLKIEFDCENCKVEIETEYKDIDIFIYNDEQAIIIENKIYAGDQPRQLERYKEVIQNENKYNDIFIIYLTLDGRPPSNDSMGKTLKLSDIICCDYTKKINEWLKECITISERKDSLLSQTIYQYKELVTELTSNVKQAEKNKEKISENIKEAWELEVKERFFTKKESAEIFKHVKWHTVADFINELETALIKIGAEIIKKPNLDEVRKVTHNNSKREKLIIKFEFNGAILQVVNDFQNGFTLAKIDGNPETWRWGYFSNEINEIKDIRFCDFSQEKTFYIIDNERRRKLIENIIKEIVPEKYNDLKKQF